MRTQQNIVKNCAVFTKKFLALTGVAIFAKLDNLSPKTYTSNTVFDLFTHAA